MEEKLAKLEGYTLPTYKKYPQSVIFQRRHSEKPLPDVRLDRPARQIPPSDTESWKDWEARFSKLEVELLRQQRGVITATAAGDKNAPEWTPKQRELLLLQLMKSRIVDGETICDSDIILNDLYYASRTGKSQQDFYKILMLSSNFDCISV